MEKKMERSQHGRARTPTQQQSRSPLSDASNLPNFDSSLKRSRKNETANDLLRLKVGKRKILLDLLQEMDLEFTKRVDEIERQREIAEAQINKQFEMHQKKLSKVARVKRCRGMKGYDEARFRIAKRAIVEGMVDEDGGVNDGGDVYCSSREEIILDAAAATAVTTVVETEVETDEYMGVVEVEEKKKIDVIVIDDEEEEEEEIKNISLVLKTDSGNDIDLSKLTSAADVAPEMGGYLKKIQEKLALLFPVLNN